MKKIAILGSTGSIGSQALDIIEKNTDRFKVTALSCRTKIDQLEIQIKKFRPEVVCVEQEADAAILTKKYSGLTVLWGEKGLCELAESADCDLLLNALVGMRGLAPTCRAIEARKDIAIANKETLVAGGSMIIKKAKEAGVKLLPVDSEHSAIFQALEGNREQKVNRLILTASGGPFLGYTKEQLDTVTVEQALRHPNWTMGAKISIDSATMMNKGLEVIEARWLFDVMPEKIEVLIHKESIIHSMVEFEDHSILAQLGVPDMRVPISYAFTYPDRIKNDVKALNLESLVDLSFSKPDTSVFRCLDLAYDALRDGGSYPVALNAANEELVRLFLEGRIRFTDIQDRIEQVLERHDPIYDLELVDILAVDQETRRYFS